MKIFKYMALALAAVLAMACVKEQFEELDPNQVPSASDLVVKIDVDDEQILFAFFKNDLFPRPGIIFKKQRMIF